MNNQLRSAQLPSDSVAIPRRRTSKGREYTGPRLGEDSDSGGMSWTWRTIQSNTRPTRVRSSPVPATRAAMLE